MCNSNHSNPLRGKFQEQWGLVVSKLDCHQLPPKIRRLGLGPERVLTRHKSFQKGLLHNSSKFCSSPTFPLQLLLITFQSAQISPLQIFQSISFQDNKFDIIYFKSLHIILNLQIRNYGFKVLSKLPKFIQLVSGEIHINIHNRLSPKSYELFTHHTASPSIGLIPGTH